MKMKKYVANTMVEAMKKVRADFGDEAIILSSKVIKSNGFLGLFQKKSIEVVAGYDEYVKPELPIRSEASSRFDERDTSSNVTLQNEIAEMKKMLREMRQVVALPHFPEELQVTLSYLQQQGIDPNRVNTIGETIHQMMKDEKRDFTQTEQWQIVQRLIREQLADLPFGGISFKRKLIHILGPTGVGKTTTIAKIAARVLLEKKKKVGFITTDTYRIAAIEQLRTYANLLQAPVEVAYSAADFQAAVKKLEDRDFIFIDTAGRNYKEQKFVEDLANLVDFSMDMESFLVLSSTSKQADMEKVIEQFSSFPIDRFIFTKMDETETVGPLLNLMTAYEMGAAYFTDGQEVPEDLIEANVDDFMRMLLAGANDA